MTGPVEPGDARAIVFAVLHEVAPEADLGAVWPGETLMEGLGFDSVDFLNFVEGIHERTGVEIPEHDYARLLTVEACTEYLAEALGSSSSPSVVRPVPGPGATSAGAITDPAPTAPTAPTG